MQSPTITMTYFWLRVLKCLLNKSLHLDQLAKLLLLHIKELKTFVDTLELFERIIGDSLPNPLKNSDGSLKDIIVAVDEFSILTDRLERFQLNLRSGSTSSTDDILHSTWTEDNIDNFINQLHEQKQLKGHMFQFIFTGFTGKIKNIISDSSKIDDRFSLSMCDFSTSKELLKGLLTCILSRKKLYQLYYFNV
jgi:hypothetical protein